MPEHSARKRSFLRSRAGIALLVFLGVAAILLVFEHRAHIFGDYWLLGGILLLCVFLHGFMHGGRGGHGGRQDREEDER